MIKRFNEFGDDSKNEARRTELFGVDRKPSNIISRQDQDFYNYYTRGKFRGLSKYELNSEVFKLAQKKDEIGILAQFCLQIERESIAADDNIVSLLAKIDQTAAELSNELENEIKNGILVDDIQTSEIEELKELKESKARKFKK